MDCKRALEDAKGDSKIAKEILKEKGAMIANKKAARATKEGLIESYIHGKGRIGVLLELNCETDFVARNPEFQELAHDLAMQISAMNPESVEDLMEQDFIKDPSMKINKLMESKISKIGENIQINRFVRYGLGE